MNTETTTTEISTDPNCLKSYDGLCERCSKRYYPNSNGKCVPVNPLCRDHNQQGECTDCYRGYSVRNGKCTISIATDPNCRKSENGVCMECYKGFYLHSYEKTCKRVNPLCKTSNPTNGACMSCYAGYTLNQGNGACEIFFKDPNCKKFRSDNTC